MSSTYEVTAAPSVLCAKGLARRSGLVDFIEPGRVQAGEEMDVVATRGDLKLRHDDGVIRDVFNNRCGDLNLLNPSARQAERLKRESLLSLVYRLYRASRNRIPDALRRELQTGEVEALISSLQRLSFMGGPTTEELALYCERRAAEDDDILAHVMDPLQVRHVLCFHRASTRDEIGIERLNTLIALSRARDTAGVRRWFEALTSGKDSLPGDTPQCLRSVLLELWRAGGADLGVLAFETAVLDAQLFEDLGWESTRTFCSQLRRITGPDCETLDGYLTDEDIDGALLAVEELQQDELVTHFRKLASSYSLKAHKELRRNILAAAGQAREVEAPAKSPATPSRVGYNSYAFSASAS